MKLYVLGLMVAFMGWSSIVKGEVSIDHSVTFRYFENTNESQVIIESEESITSYWVNTAGEERIGDVRYNTPIGNVVNAITLPLEQFNNLTEMEFADLIFNLSSGRLDFGQRSAFGIGSFWGWVKGCFRSRQCIKEEAEIIIPKAINAGAVDLTKTCATKIIRGANGETLYIVKQCVRGNTRPGVR